MDIYLELVKPPHDINNLHDVSIILLQYRLFRPREAIISN